MTFLPRKLLNFTVPPLSFGRLNSGALSPACIKFLREKIALQSNHCIRRGLLVASSLLLLAALAPAQVAQKTREGPRALAAVRFTQLSATGIPQGPATLVPITIFYKGEYLDASIYLAQPVPMALDPQTVYEVQREGVGLGLFTIQSPRQRADNWIALGEWQPAQAEAEKKSASKSHGAINVEEDRPVLKRGDEGAPPSAGSAGAAKNSGGANGAGSAGNAASKTPAQNAGASTGQNTAAAYKSEEQDPDRPVLRRGKAPQAETEQATEKAAKAASAAEAAGAKNPSANTGPVLVAVSDPAPSDERTFRFPWTAKEQTTLTRAMQKMALQSTQDYDRRYKLPPAAALQQTAIRAFDLFTDNDAELVYAATQNVAGPRARQVFVTVVGITDASGNVNQIFSDVTDSDHLDVHGRIELIDAVDSTGNGRGDLLFRRIGIDSVSYELYRVTGNQLWKLFDSNAS